VLVVVVGDVRFISGAVVVVVIVGVVVVKVALWFVMVESRCGGSKVI
jgi:hypothetical protein